MKLGLGIMVAAICLTFAACSGSAVNTTTPANGNTSNAAPAGKVNNAEARAYPQESVDAFMTSCEEAGRDAAFCTCVLGKIQAKYSFEQFSEIESQIQAGEASKEFVDFSEKARAECAK